MLLHLLSPLTLLSRLPILARPELGATQVCLSLSLFTVYCSPYDGDNFQKAQNYGNEEGVEGGMHCVPLPGDCTPWPPAAQLQGLVGALSPSLPNAPQCVTLSPPYLFPKLNPFLVFTGTSLLWSLSLSPGTNFSKVLVVVGMDVGWDPKTEQNNKETP